jgi:HSP20 family protein
VRLDVPGVKTDDIDVQLSGNDLVISGEKREETEERGEEYFHCERRYGSFRRIIELPPTADVDHVSAECADGVLTISVPKQETAKPRRVMIESKPKKEAGRQVPVGAR